MTNRLLLSVGVASLPLSSLIGDPNGLARRNSQAWQQCRWKINETDIVLASGEFLALGTPSEEHSVAGDFHELRTEALNTESNTKPLLTHMFGTGGGLGRLGR